MNRWLSLSIVLLLTLLVPRVARAWDGPSYWYDSASGSNVQGARPGPGGGGVLGTGGAKDYNITCANCHIKAEGKIDVQLTFDGAAPPSMYKPGHTYQVTATLTGEHLGLSGCMGSPPAANNNNFAVTAEDDSGNLAGSFAADYGSASACPASSPPPTFGGGSMVYNDCRAVLTTGADLTSWTFSWTAPASGTGSVTMSRPQRRNDALAWIGLMPAVGIVVAARRRRAR